MTIPAAVWCVTCGAVPDVAVTVERRGVLVHYGACWSHVTSVAERARLDVEQIDSRDRAAAFAAERRRIAELDLEKHSGAIDGVAAIRRRPTRRPTRARAVTQPRCSATTLEGRPCGAFAVGGEETCASHNPHSQADRRRALTRNRLPRLESERSYVERRLITARERLAVAERKVAAAERRLVALDLELEQTRADIGGELDRVDLDLADRVRLLAAQARAAGLDATADALDRLELEP